MKMLLVFLALGVISAVNAGTDCYPDIGCFENGYPFYDPPNRPVDYMPDSREEVATTFLLNTRQNPYATKYQLISNGDDSTILKSYFSGQKDTKIMIHGYTENGEKKWAENMMMAFLNADDYNVIRVEWSEGSGGMYGSAVANSRIAGAEISLLMDRIKELFGVTTASFHLIGFSLGAHAAGYAGERQPGLARITGLDPAGPYFEDTDPIVRLDPTDARFVDIMHTDTDPVYTLGMGIYMPIGHVDIYANGGQEQPGCDQGLVESIISEGGLLDGVLFVICNHLRAPDLFTESIESSCPFTALRCEASYDEFTAGNCWDPMDYIEMGIHADKYVPAKGVTNARYYAVTSDGKDDQPFCGFQFRIEVFFDDHRRAEDAKGTLYVTFIGPNGDSSKTPLSPESIKYIPGAAYSFLAVSDIDLSDVVGMYFEWTYDAAWYKPWEWDFFIDPEIYVHKMTVSTVQDPQTYLMCGPDDPIEAEEDVVAFFPVTECR